ncbi:MAG: hypothetical protein V2J14_12095 [Erythrobacter sp.]|jgi:hypothetical protein|nr:hypothetical protein [Erythrobacter sp.]
MDLNPPTLAGWYDVDLLFRLGIAALIGLLLGIDREWTDHGVEGSWFPSAEDDRDGKS